MKAKRAAKPRRSNPEPDTTTRSKPFLIRLTPDEHKQLTAAAKRSNRSLALYLVLSATYCDTHRIQP